MKQLMIYSIIFILFLSSCNRFLCGELPPELKMKINRVNNLYSDYLKVENIPCENFYINVVFHNDKIDTSMVHSVHKILYDKENNIGWPVLLVYNMQEEYIFSHNYENKIYKQSGD
jgi:hypothetical protein